MPIVRTHLVNMALFVNRRDGTSVVWPGSGKHTLYLIRPNTREVTVRPNANLAYECDGLLQEEVTQPSRSLVPHLSDIAGTPALLAENRSGILKGEGRLVAAALFLPPGRFVTEEASGPFRVFAKTRWVFTRSNQTTHVQRVTDLVVHEMEVKKGCELRIGRWWTKVNNDLDITFDNEDKCPPARAAREYALNEMRELYALAGHSRLPIGKAVVPDAGPALEFLRARHARHFGAVSTLGCDPVCGPTQINYKE